MPGAGRMVICSFTGAYADQTFYRKADPIWVDLSDIGGTNCYLDENARKEIRKRLSAAGAFDRPDLHFIDSGNYHYMTLLFLEEEEKKKRNFALLVFDNHPDMKAAAFGDITSCGGWILEAAEKFSHLKQICLVGVDQGLLEELKPLPECVVEKLVSWDGTAVDGLSADLPLYISIDKDVMSEPYTYCQWSQGSMRPDTVMEIALDAEKRAANVLGIDICGESEEICNDLHRAANDRTNAEFAESENVRYLLDQKNGENTADNQI